MILQYSPWLIPFAISAIITGTLTIISWQNRDRIIPRIFMVLTAALTIWAAGAALESVIADFPTIFIINALTIPAIVIIPVALLLMVFCYMGRDHLVTARTTLLLLIIPVCTVILVATDPIHHLYYTGVIPHLMDGAITWEFLHGPFFWITLAYEYIIMGVIVALLVRQIAITRDNYRQPLVFFLIACCIPLSFGIAYSVGIPPFPRFLCLTPIGFSLASLIMAPGVFRYSPQIPVSYPLIFTTMKDSVVVIDTDDRITDLNPAAERMLDVSLNGVLGKPVREIIPFIALLLDIPERADREVSAEIHTGSGADERFFDANHRPIQSSRGVSLRLILLHDVTDRKRADDAIRESERKYRELVELLPEIVFESDLDGNLLYVNNSGLSIFGYTRDDLKRGLNMIAHIIEADRERVRKDILKVVTSGKSPGSEYTAIKKDGSTFPVFVVSTPVLQNSTCTGLRGILIDMTERRKSELAIQTAMKKLTILNNITRHDIVNKLTALGAYLSLTQDSVSDPDTADNLKECEKIIRSINEHIEFMKDYQEIGIHAPLWQDLDAVVRRVADSCANTGITIVPVKNNIEIFADPLFEKVIYNLLDNAIRHGEHVTRISFTARKTGHGTCIMYEDDGAGISQGDKKHLFEKGFGKNTGLGLFLSREILGITGISITETGIPGKGARFEIDVPEEGYRQKKNNS